MDLKKKIDTIQSMVSLQFEDKDGSLKKLLNKIAGINSPHRQTVIHASFEPNGADGVKFTRVTAKGELEKEPKIWTAKDFKNHFAEMEKNAAKLEELVQNLKPYVPSLDFSDPRNSMYLAIL